MAYSDSMKLNMSSPEEIGKAIQKRRRAQKITQKEFAQRLGKSERTIQKYESGEILMKIDVVKQIANELNVPWQELLSSEDTNVSDNNTTSEYPACEFNTMSDVINALFAITELTDFSFELASSMVPPPLPSAKSYHWLRSIFTLNEASVSSLNGDLYHRLIPCCLTGEYPKLCR